MPTRRTALLLPLPFAACSTPEPAYVPPGPMRFGYLTPLPLNVAAVEVRAEIFGRAAVVRGRQALTPVPEGTAVTTTADVSVDAPVVGRQAEAAVRQLVTIVLGREAELIRECVRAD